MGGEHEKVERTRQVIPDAVYTSWQEIEKDLGMAITAPPANPVVPDSAFAGYSGTPLVKKLGIKLGTSVALVHAPDDFAETLGHLPDGASLDRVGPEDSDLIILFARSLTDLEAGVCLVASVLRPGASAWMAWPKKASGVVTDLTQNDVRALGLAAGLVDYKICSIDRTWSGTSLHTAERVEARFPSCAARQPLQAPRQGATSGGCLDMPSSTLHTMVVLVSSGLRQAQGRTYLQVAARQLLIIFAWPGRRS